ncbi:MAG: hypothetical protein P4M05_36565 [Bradyrhizobium sp.]|nr:hypothetical protein [Bradyrhizobium sp.]
MIDDPAKTDRLVAEMEASLPLQTRLSPNVQSTLAKQSPDSVIPDRCMVTKIFYMGEEGGIVCGLNIGGPDAKTPFFVSITHLIFDRRCPVFRQIEAYQRHRVKKLKQQRARAIIDRTHD